MKTINFLHYVKYPVLLFIAFFGILIGGQQTAPRQFAKIGGNGVGSPAPRSFVSNDYPETGGLLTPPRSFYRSSEPIGRGGNETRKIFADAISDSAASEGLDFKKYFTDQLSHLPRANSTVQYSVYDFSDNVSVGLEIGGQNTHGNETRKFGFTEIGGGQTAPRPLADIGGNQTAPRLLQIGGPGNQGPPRV